MNPIRQVGASNKTKLPDIELRKAAFLREFEQTPFPSKALRITGTQYNDLAYWKQSDPAFAEKYRRTRKDFLQSVADRAEEGVIDALNTPRDPWLKLRVLELRHPDWKTQGQGGLTQVNIETLITNPHTIDNVSPSVNSVNSENAEGVDTDTTAPTEGHTDTHENTGDTPTPGTEGVGGGGADETGVG